MSSKRKTRGATPAKRPREDDGEDDAPQDKKRKTAHPAAPKAAAPAGLRVRRDLRDLQREFNDGNTEPLEKLMTAWAGIQALPPDDPNSFFCIGGYHGEPFRGAGWGSGAYWGGYCNHGNILFPTWHRAYCLRLENALRSVEGCEDVTLPYWNECSEASLAEGVPDALTMKTFKYGSGKIIPNPLFSFTLNRALGDFISTDPVNYSKPKGYETVRYPLSGLVGTDDDKAATEEHNRKYPDHDTNVKLLNQNVTNWLNSDVVIKEKKKGKKKEKDHVSVYGRVHDKFVACVDAPNYTLFSNTSSTAQWNNDHPEAKATALESPHNAIHLAVGGIDVPQQHISPLAGANGDMAENNTAALDPIFFFHHCFIDSVFWLWQKRNGFTDDLGEIMDGYPGTNSVDGQGPTPGTEANSWLTLESPLQPFKAEDGSRYYNSLDMVNIEKQLGYTYQWDPTDPFWQLQHKKRAPAAAAVAELEPEAAAAPRGPTVKVSGISRARFRGSFVVAIWGNVNGKRVLLDAEPVLSRWSVQGCANCQNHLAVTAFASVPHHLAPVHSFDSLQPEATIHTHEGAFDRYGHPVVPSGEKKKPRAAAHAAASLEAMTVDVAHPALHAAARAAGPRKLFHVELLHADGTVEREPEESAAAAVDPEDGE